MGESFISYFVLNTQTRDNTAVERQKENEILALASDLVFRRVSLAGLSRIEMRICLYSRAFVGQQSLLRSQLNGLSRLTEKHY